MAKAKILKRTRVYDGFFKVDQLDIQMTCFDGHDFELTRFCFERGHSVSILLYDPKEKVVVLAEEFRTGCISAGDDPFSLALPAGMIDENESPIDVVIRETEEEVGIVPELVTAIHPGAYVSPGGTSEKIGIYYAEIDSSKVGGIHGLTKEGEQIKTHVIQVRKFLDMASRGEITDLKTLTAAFWLSLQIKS